MWCVDYFCRNVLDFIWKKNILFVIRNRCVWIMSIHTSAWARPLEMAMLVPHGGAKSITLYPYDAPFSSYRAKRVKGHAHFSNFLWNTSIAYYILQGEIQIINMFYVLITWRLSCCVLHISHLLNSMLPLIVVISPSMADTSDDLPLPTDPTTIVSLPEFNPETMRGIQIYCV